MQRLIFSPALKLVGLYCPLLAILMLFKLEPSSISLVFYILAVILLLLSFHDSQALIPALAAVVFGIAASSVLFSGLLYYPFLVSSLLCCFFVLSYFKPRCFVQQIALRMEPDLPEAGLAYCRNVHLLWTAFLGLNAIVALASVTDLKFWAWYNGVISYLCIFLLAAGEYLYRIRFKSRLDHE